MAPKILITSCGRGPAMSFIYALKDKGFLLYGASENPYAPGLYLTEGFLTPDSKSDPQGFISSLKEIIAKERIDIIAPVYDGDLDVLRVERSSLGCPVLLASDYTLNLALDKWQMYEHLEGKVPQPHSFLHDSFSSQFEIEKYPVITKPRDGCASHGFAIIQSKEDLDLIEHGNIVQEFLPGREYSVDMFANKSGHVVSAVSRERLYSESGIYAAGKTISNPKLEELATRVAKEVKLTGIANIQFKDDEHGTPKLMEINPRVPGAMSLTVASGANMPLMWVCEALGLPLPNASFKEIAMIRQHVPLFLDVDQLKKHSKVDE